MTITFKCSLGLVSRISLPAAKFQHAQACFPTPGRLWTALSRVHWGSLPRLPTYLQGPIVMLIEVFKPKLNFYMRAPTPHTFSNTLHTRALPLPTLHSPPLPLR